LIYLGATPTQGVKFHQPGAVSDARFMAKAVYSLKIAMFQSQFLLSKQQLDGIRRLCIFIARFYAKLWFIAPVASAAPFSVLSFLRDVASFSEIDPVLVDIVFQKMSNHLWYLSQECVSLAFFDSSVPEDVKQKMRAALDKPGWEEP